MPARKKELRGWVIPKLVKRPWATRGRKQVVFSYLWVYGTSQDREMGYEF